LPPSVGSFTWDAEVVAMFDLIGWLVLGGPTLTALVPVLEFGVVTDLKPPERLRRPPE
jgi:hypothetical protein